MRGQNVEIYTIHSQKGGVGKTSLALAIAGWSFFESGRRTLIIDCDLTGTSLIDLFWACDEDLRKNKPIRFLNELLLASPVRFRQYSQINVKSFYLKVPNSENIHYIPSSPIPKDIRMIVALISQEHMLHFFQSRMEEVLDLVVKNGVETIIIDTPPGLFGLSVAMMDLEKSKEDNWRKKAFFVTTTDSSDYRAMLSSLSEYRVKGQYKKAKAGAETSSFLLNKFSNKKFREGAFAWDKILEDFNGTNPFPSKQRSVDIDLIGEIRSRLEKTGADACPLIEGFDMEDIVMTIEGLVTGKPDVGPMGEWCRTVKKMAGF